MADSCRWDENMQVTVFFTSQTVLLESGWSEDTEWSASKLLIPNISHCWVLTVFIDLKKVISVYLKKKQLNNSCFFLFFFFLLPWTRDKRWQMTSWRSWRCTQPEIWHTAQTDCRWSGPGPRLHVWHSHHWKHRGYANVFKYWDKIQN